ncbi:MAG: glycosyltransferase family 2 protein [Candidatus Hodarchaeota archaeon]
MSIKNLKSDLEVIIPTLNEEKSIGSVIERTLMYTDKVLVIDGWSDDGTIEIAKKMGARIMFQNGRGKGAALKEALKYVDGDIIMIMDGDGSMKPEEIPLFLNGIYSGADIVKGSRFLGEGGSEDISLVRRFGNTLFTILVNVIWRSNFTDLCYGFMAFKKDAIKKLTPIILSKGFTIETEMIIKAKKLGLKIIEVPSFELRRIYGHSKLNSLKDGWEIFLMILREALV